jgi:hypothetical protein
MEIKELGRRQVAGPGARAGCLQFCARLGVEPVQTVFLDDTGATLRPSGTSSTSSGGDGEGRCMIAKEFGRGGSQNPSGNLASLGAWGC